MNEEPRMDGCRICQLICPHVPPQGELWEDIKAAAIDARDNPKPQENALVNAAEGEHLDLPTLISVGFTPFPWALLIALSPVLSRCGWGGGGGCQH